MKTHFRTIWISDIHLGSNNCNIEAIQNFLTEVKADTIFLMGDIIDGWAIKRRNKGIPQSHLNVIRSILSKARKNTNIYYVIGNHDEFLRFLNDILPFKLGNVYIGNEFFYTTLLHGQVWCIHGDLYDCITRLHRWLAVWGDIGYTGLVYLNKWFNKLRSIVTKFKLL